MRSESLTWLAIVPLVGLCIASQFLAEVSPLKLVLLAAFNINL